MADSIDTHYGVSLQQQAFNQTIAVEITPLYYDKAYIDNLQLTEALNIMNDQKPLTNHLNISQSEFTIKCHLPVENDDICNKAYIDAISVESGSIKDRLISQPNMDGSLVLSDNQMQITLNDSPQLLILDNRVGSLIQTEIQTDNQLKISATQLMNLIGDNVTLTLGNDIIETTNRISYLYGLEAVNPSELITLDQLGNSIADFVTQAELTQQLAGQTHDKIITSTGNFQASVNDINGFSINNNTVGSEMQLLTINRPFDDAIRTVIASDIDLLLHAQGEISFKTGIKERLIIQDQVQIAGQLINLENTPITYANQFVDLQHLQYNHFSKNATIDLLAPKADKQDLYDKIAIDSLLDYKQDKLQTILYYYNKLQTDGLLDEKADLTDINIIKIRLDDEEADAIIMKDKIELNRYNITEEEKARIDNDLLRFTKIESDSRFLWLTTKLNTIQAPIASLNMNNQIISNLAQGVQSTDAVTKQQMIDSDIINTNKIDQEILDRIADNSATNNRINQEVTDRVNNDNLRYNKIESDAKYQSSTITLNQVLQPTDNVSLNQKRLVNLSQAILGSDAVNLTQMASADNLIKNQFDQLQLDLIDESDSRNQGDIALQDQLTALNKDHTKISSSNAQVILQCSSQNGLNITSNGQQIGSILCSVGQAGFNPLQIRSNDKLQFVSNNGSTSFYSGTGQTSNSLYIASSSDIAGDNCQDQLVVGSGSNRQQLTISSGHIGAQPYSVICNNSATATNLQLCAGQIPQSNNTLNMFTDSISSIYPIQNQFNRKTGYSQTTVIDQPNQFISKAYADATYSLGSGTTVIPKYIQNNTNFVSCNDNALDGIVLQNRGAANVGQMLVKINSQYGNSSQLQISAFEQPTLSIETNNGKSLICQRDSGRQEILSIRAGQSETDATINIIADQYNLSGLSILANRQMGTTASQTGVLHQFTYLTKQTIDATYLTKLNANSTYIDKTVNSIASFRQGSTITRPTGSTQGNYYITGDDLAGSQSCYISNSNVVNEVSSVMPINQWFRQPSNPLIDNDLTRLGYINKLNLNYFNQQPLTADLDLRSATFATLCSDPISILQIANKGYVDGQLANNSTGQSIHIYRISALNGSGFASSLATGQQLLCSKISGNSDQFLSTSCQLYRGTQNIVIACSVTNQYVYDQFSFNSSFRTSVAQPVDANNYNASYSMRNQSISTYLTTVIPTKSFQLAWFLDAGVSPELFYIDITVHKL